MTRNLFYSILVISFCATFPLLGKGEKLSVSIRSESAILVNADSGAILFEKKPHEPHYPASITKIVTAICALEKCSDSLNVMIPGDVECVGTVTEEQMRRSNYKLPNHLLTPDGCHIGIKSGELLSLKDLLYGMMLASGDDAANIIAKYAGGTIPKFIETMNQFVKRVGCQSTTFYNPHGLHHPKQQTTAYDMALITKEALKNPLFREIVKTTHYTRPKTNKQEATTLVQTNKLLRRGPYFYPKAIGVKTGYYSLAKHTLVAAAKDGDRTLIAVLLKGEGKDPFIDAKKLFEAAFNQPKVRRTVLKKGAQHFSLQLPSASRPLKGYILNDIMIEYYPAEEPDLKYQLLWDKPFKLPIAKDQKIGYFLVLSEKGHVLQKVPVFAEEKVTVSWLSSLKEFEWYFLLKIIAVLAVLAALGFSLLQLKSRSAD